MEKSKVTVHARGIPEKLKIALYAMTGFALVKLVPSKRLRDNLTIDIHLKHHSEGGEASLAKNANRYRPRHFKVIIDHHRAEFDDYKRRRGDTEWAHEILKTLAHELVHVKQYVYGELTWRNWSTEDSVSFRDAGLYWDGVHYDAKNYGEYYELPYEIEAHGRERGLLVSFLERWAEIERELEDEFPEFEE